MSRGASRKKGISVEKKKKRLRTCEASCCSDYRGSTETDQWTRGTGWDSCQGRSFKPDRLAEDSVGIGQRKIWKENECGEPLPEPLLGQLPEGLLELY